MQMQIPSNLTTGAFIFEFIIGFFISILILLYGMSFVKSYIKKKEWDESRKFVIIVNGIWLIINIAFEFVFLYFVGKGTYLSFFPLPSLTINFYNF